MKCHTIPFLLLLFIGNLCVAQTPNSVPPTHKVTLKEAHIGNLDIDTKLLDSYQKLSENERQFYFQSRKLFSDSIHATFSNPIIIESAASNNIKLLGGPMLGNLRSDGVSVWLRPATSKTLLIRVYESENKNKSEKVFMERHVKAGIEERIEIEGLNPNTQYNYAVFSQKQKLAQGQFTTALENNQQGICSIAFGSCFHKIGLHNPNLINQIVKRKPQAMMLLGDIAVDDRENKLNMHRADYLLRDVSTTWQKLAANIPLYTSWDDHDYLNNDLSGIPQKFTIEDRDGLRTIWEENWNNPQNPNEGIYFNTQIGPVEIIMLDTRSCRTVEKRGEAYSYLGIEQMDWLKTTLQKSKAPFKIISSGTMWSDYVTNGKDSWGTWDTLARQEIFNIMETENISGVLLISGDRHGARGFTIPQPSGHSFYEFEAASLGGVPGPNGIVNTPNQLFGYSGPQAIAFGEFTFDTNTKTPTVTFRLIDELGKILKEINIPYSKLIPN